METRNLKKIKIYPNGNPNMKFQGDISVIAVDESNVKNMVFKSFPRDGYVVAIGEKTGHFHKLVAEPEAIVEMAEDANGVFIRVLKGMASLTGHREHEDIKTISPLAGQVWWVGRRFEFDEVKERMVRD